jgi:hypothetical protein
MRFNQQVEDAIGSGDLHHPATSASPRASGSDFPLIEAKGGCPRFGNYPADRHRESEIVGGAFAHD